MKTFSRTDLLNGGASRQLLAVFMSCLFFCSNLQSQVVDLAPMEAGHQSFQLVIGPEVSVSMQEILRVVSASGADSQPTWTKPTAFGTGGWSMKLDGRVLGEWFSAGKTRTQACLRLNGSALLFTSNACVVVVQPDRPLTVAGERLSKTRILVTLPEDAIMGKMLDWLLSGSAGVVSVAESGAAPGKASWRWERNSVRPFSLLLYANERSTPEAETTVHPQSNTLLAELKRLLEAVRASGNSDARKAEQAATACYRFLDQNADDAPQGAREMRNQIASWLERLQSGNRGIEQARDGEFLSRPYRVAKAERARDEMVGKYEVVRIQMTKYLSKWEYQLAASAPRQPAPGVANRASADGVVELSVDGVPIVHVTTGDLQKEEP